MTQIAHLSDLHLLEDGHAERRGLPRRRLLYLTMGRRNCAHTRRKSAVQALETARKSGADHVVITGDLTEDGIDPQFEVLAELLADSRLSPSNVTLMPGNHDAYADGTAFARALRGPLRAYAETSAPGVPLLFRDAAILPMCTAFEQPYLRSAGSIERDAIAAASRLAEESQRAGRALVLAMHHPPVPRVFPLNWIDGLQEHAAIGAILARHDHVHVVHGHIHEAVELAVRPGAGPRIFSTQAVVDGASPVRVYHARHGRLWPAPAGVAQAGAPALSARS